MTTEYRNIVIVGASFGGHNTANALVPHLPPGYRILLVDALDFAFWPIAAFRAATNPGWETKMTVPLTTDRVFATDSPHQVIPGNKVLQCREKSIVLEHPFEGSTEVPFYRCVIATGASQQPPCVPGLDMSEAQYIENIRQSQRATNTAQQIVIIGGGAVGIEWAGEIRAINPSAKISIIHSHAGLLSPSDRIANSKRAENHPAPSYSSPAVAPKFSRSMEALCKKLDIELILQDKVLFPAPEGSSASSDDWDGSNGLQKGIKNVHLQSGKSLSADYVIIGVGSKPNSQMVEKTDLGALDGKSKLVAVDEYLKVVSKSQGSVFHGQYYAIGDVCSAPGFKVARAATAQAKLTAANIIDELQGRSLKMYDMGLQGLGIPVGPNEASGYGSFPWIGNILVPGWFILRSRGRTIGIEDHFADRFQGSKKVKIDFTDVFEKQNHSTSS
ncbi:hypothetical protein IAR55_000909 [Kwoniella newhampshirensis]|uniref:FAD/NAD(P)-binding domain-containing protein n=1 Tax=Kwoniella newhampshirensis TaxID=1651941 RepID=A0AAW0Z4R7_9TREE